MNNAGAAFEAAFGSGQRCGHIPKKDGHVQQVLKQPQKAESTMIEIANLNIYSKNRIPARRGSPV